MASAVTLEPVERISEGQGTPEAQWRAWPGLARLPALQLKRWVQAQARVVVVAPHPDDEVLICGALMCVHAQRGGAVLIIAVTDGESTHDGSAHWNSESLAKARRSESAEGIAMLASSKAEVLRLGLPDGDVAAHIDSLQEKLREVLLPDDVVFTTWRRDGHPDHEAVGSASAKVCAAIGCRIIEAPVLMWNWAEPADRRVPWSRMRGLAIPPEVLVKKRMALAAHVTQLVPRDTGEGPVLGDCILERLERETEYFIV
jgi:LmbE family N-acetylglucosaminyl deacetylase